MSRILLLGSGGREHAIAWKLKQSEYCDSLFITPGNPGTATIGTNLSIAILDFESIRKACVEYDIDMLVVGPEEPLVLGIRDYFESDDTLKHIAIIGPGKSGARLEGSKDFSKAFMQRNAIPTATYKTFTAKNFDEGVEYLQHHSMPVVLKADGLAAGKGVLICNTAAHAIEVFTDMLQKNTFGAAGSCVVIEEFLTGIEMSLFVLTDGQNFVLLPEAKDYKKIGEGDTGLNTGGMGAISPVPFFDDSLRQEVIRTIVLPTITGLRNENIPYKGIIFIGLIVKDTHAHVIEYNCRLGDPETEVVLPRLQTDLVKLFEATASGNLDDFKVEFSENHTCGIVSVSGGYPGESIKGIEIKLNETKDHNAILFHAGTMMHEEKLKTNGGRVLVTVGQGETLDIAKHSALSSVENINYDGHYYRKDIGFEFL